MKPLSPETLAFIRAHRSDDMRTLALQAPKYPKVDMPEALIQIAGRQIAEKKIPSWAEREDIRYPQHLSMEQCSSEVTARYKASLAEGESFADLTGGFGVDCAFIASRFRRADYVERQETLCELAAHNFALLGLDQIKVHHTDAITYLQHMNPVDCLYLDPARRNNQGGKTVAISDCEPDVSRLESLLAEKGKMVMVKLSPMLDVALAIQTLRFVSQVHIVAVNNECKELIILLKKEDKDTDNIAGKEVVIHCEQAVNNLLTTPFIFTLSEEKNAVCEYACHVGKYLYEPGASLLKAGAYRLLGSRYNVKKLHPNSHLYTSDTQKGTENVPARNGESESYGTQFPLFRCRTKKETEAEGRGEYVPLCHDPKGRRKSIDKMHQGKRHACSASFALNASAYMRICFTIARSPLLRVGERCSFSPSLSMK